MNVRLRSRRSLVGLLLVGLVGLPGLAGAAYAANSYYVDSRDVDDRIIVRGGPVRLGKSVYAHSNATHELVGITKVSLQNKCTLKLTLDWRPGEKVISLVVDEDEALARMGISAGGSGGGTSALIYLFKGGKQVCANSKTFSANANVWVSITSIDPKKPADTTVPPAPASSNPQGGTAPTPAPEVPDAEPLDPLPPAQDPDFVE